MAKSLFDDTRDTHSSFIDLDTTARDALQLALESKPRDADEMRQTAVMLLLRRASEQGKAGSSQWLARVIRIIYAINLEG